MKIKEFFINLARKYLFNAKWRCNVCGKEIFDGGYFCDDCKEKLPYVLGSQCNHCGRALINAQEYCSTCKEIMVDVNKARSVFEYKDEIIGLIHKLKFGNGGYLARVFATEICVLYLKNRFDADVLTFVPMTERSIRKRGYNQSQLIAEELGKLLSLPVKDLSIKKEETKKQEGLTRKERLVNLEKAFKVTDKKSVKDKKIMIIDDVSTTGATAQALASQLKKAGANAVYLISVASVAPYDGY